MAFVPIIVGVIGGMAALAVLLVAWGRSWERSLQRPALKRLPLVSIMVPAYNSPYLAETLRSLAALDYPRKEIILAYDAPNPPRALCKRYGVRLVAFPTRQGKAVALNKASKLARGSIIFSVDSDTVVEPSCLRKLVPWFSDPRIAAVAPRFTVHEPRTLFERLATIEAAMNHMHIRTHMRFGTMLAFRGCGVALRTSTFRKLGGWPETLAEDIDFSQSLLRNGFRIHYEPAALVSTREPPTVFDLQRQRVRWGRGAAFAFFTRKDHRFRRFLRSPQFLLYFSHALFLFFSLSAFFLWQFSLTALPVLSLALLSAITLKQAALVLGASAAALLSDVYLTAFLAALVHVGILIAPTAGRREALWLLPWMALIPLSLLFYFQGAFIGMRDKWRHRKQLDLRYW